MLSEREQGPRLWCCTLYKNCSRALLQGQPNAQHQSAGPCSRLHQCCSVQATRKQPCLLVLPLYDFWHQTQLGPIGVFTSLHQGCSPKQDDNSLACWCYHRLCMSFGTCTQLCCISGVHSTTSKGFICFTVQHWCSETKTVLAFGAVTLL